MASGLKKVPRSVLKSDRPGGIDGLLRFSQRASLELETIAGRAVSTVLKYGTVFEASNGHRSSGEALQWSRDGVCIKYFDYDKVGKKPGLRLLKVTISQNQGAVLEQKEVLVAYVVDGQIYDLVLFSGERGGSNGLWKSRFDSACASAGLPEKRRAD